MADLGIVGEVQHESYIASWLKALRNNKRYIFKAASAASKAHRYLMGTGRTVMSLQRNENILNQDYGWEHWKEKHSHSNEYSSKIGTIIFLGLCNVEELLRHNDPIQSYS